MYVYAHTLQYYTTTHSTPTGNPCILHYNIYIRTCTHTHTHTHNSVEADLTAVSESKVVVQFKKFNLFGGIFSFKAPQRARGELDTTYLDR